MKFNKKIEAIAMKILAKGRKPLAIVEEPKRQSLKIPIKKVVKKSTPEPVQKPKPKAMLVKPKVEPKYPPLKWVVMSKKEEARILKLAEKDPKRALAISAKRTSEIKDQNDKIMAYNALTEKERERLVEKEAKIKEGIKSLTASLPDKCLIDSNWDDAELLRALGKVAFDSALANDILFSDEVIKGLTVTVRAHKIVITDNSMFNSAMSKLVSWANLGKVLIDVEGSDLARWLAIAATDYRIQQQRLKPLEYYTEELVARSIDRKLKFTGDSSTRKEVIDTLALSITGVAIELGFHTDKNKSAFYVNSNSNKFGMSTISKKDMLGLITRTVEGSPYYGRISGDSVPKTIMNGVLAMLPL